MWMKNNKTTAPHTGTSLHQLSVRLRENYPDCTLTESGDHLTVSLPLGEAHVEENRVEFFVAGELLDTVDAEGDALYEAVESFLLFLKSEEELCNPIYTAAIEHAQKRSSRVLYIAAGLELLAMLGLMASKQLWCALLVLLLPVVSLLPLRTVRLRSLRRDWVCPHCGAQLPLTAKTFIPQPNYVSCCPQCRTSLLDSTQTEQLKQDLMTEEEDEEDALDSTSPLPQPGGKWPSLLSGILLLLFTLVSLLLMFVDIEQEAPAAIVVNALTLLSTGGLALALLLCRTSEPASLATPKIVLREQKWIAGLGIFCYLPGLVLIVLSFSLSMEIPVNLWAVSLLSLLGLLLVLTGVWAILARKNRSLMLFSDQLLYCTSWGKHREFPIQQIASVKLTASHSVKFLDSRGKTLFSVENNMLGVDRLLDWIAEQDLPLLTTKSFDQQMEQMTGVVDPLSWNEADRTKFHDHLPAIRVGLVLVVALFALGCMGTLPLYLFTDLKMYTAIYLSALTPLPLLIYCFIFTPVLVFNDRPKGATAEWKAMHIKFPTMTVSLLSLLLMWQVYHFWDQYMLQIVDTGRLLSINLVLGVVLIVLFILRTPKRLRGEGLFMISLCLFVFSYVTSYGANLALCDSPRHYPLVVEERHVPAEDAEDDSYTLTIRLDDGTEKELNVSAHLYELETSGTELVVCEKKSPLGIRMIRLHIPTEEISSPAEANSGT